MPAFRHEALFYAGEDEFLAGILPFLREGVERDEPALVAVSQERAAALQSELGQAAEHVHFADMAQLGRNPARIIPAWHSFVDTLGAGGRPIRGIGEPIWPGRTADELVECHQHESLLNLAFGDRDSFWLMCPYDTERLAPDVVECARHTHPLVTSAGDSRVSDVYEAPAERPSPFDGTLPPPAYPYDELHFTKTNLRDVRRFAEQRGRLAGMDRTRTADLVLALGELSTNSVLHGGGSGVVRAWREGTNVVCEVSDKGRFERPLLGREPLHSHGANGRGLWLANHLCDLVQMRSTPDGSVVRVHMQVADEPV
jgi:anti-sigma regulatory factor (Ser/Thr protein kinase)